MSPRFSRLVLAGLVGGLLFSAAPPANCEPMGSTTSDGAGSPYSDARQSWWQRRRWWQRHVQYPAPPSSRNRAICDGNCPYPTGSSRQEGCIQKCLATITRR